MSRKASRATNAARKKALATRRERAHRAAGASADVAVETGAQSKRRANVRAQRAMSSASAPAASDARLWTALLVGGAAVAIGLLGRQIVDMVQDRARPTLLQNDVYSALGSIALLAIVGLFAYNRRHLRR